MEFCDDKNILDKICLNKVFYAKFNNEGDSVAHYTSDQLDEINSNLDLMYARAADDLPACQVINYDSRLFVANSQHLWGEAPFHYVDALYIACLHQLGIPVAESSALL